MREQRAFRAAAADQKALRTFRDRLIHELVERRRAELARLVKRGDGGDKKAAHILHFLHPKLSFFTLKQRKRAVGDNISFLGGGEQRAVRFSVVGIHGADFKRADILLDAAQFFLALAVLANERARFSRRISCR